ncbi:MAG TPA: formimidoylglutamate deiminase [Mesorhizobium sp.]|nr:formimidoylglutamate deiminase [Mesorhizobium sp.]
MPAIFAEHALLPEGWAAKVRIGLTGAAIASVDIDAAPQPGDERAPVLIPGVANLHSHAFQRGMAGLAETRGPAADNFWTWREAMYRFALTMTPEQNEAVAAFAYAEMLESGFTRVGEFHYLHHAPDGSPYADLAEMAGRIAAAADAAGIGLTLLPVFYAHSDFSSQKPSSGQRRFLNGLDSFARLHEGSIRVASALPGAVVGAAPHSLRAATPDEIAAIEKLAPAGPLHIHAAEQTREVEDCVAWSGQRPVEWLLDHADVDRRWCLIHATHMTAEETARLARSGAVAGLCPLTEANLGDGVFPARAFTDAGGRWAIGSDSNVLVGLVDELRQLEAAQRLTLRERNVLAAPGRSTGRSLVEAALLGGAQACGVPANGIAAGAAADLVTLRPLHASAAAGQEDAVLDGWIFARSAAVESVWAAGRKVVSEGRHVAREKLHARFRKALGELLA